MVATSSVNLLKGNMAGLGNPPDRGIISGGAEERIWGEDGQKEQQRNKKENELGKEENVGSEAN